MNATLTSSAGPVARHALVGIDQPVPQLDGRFAPYVNLDHAASTPQIVAGNITGKYRADINGSHHPAGHIAPTLYSLDAP